MPTSTPARSALAVCFLVLACAALSLLGCRPEDGSASANAPGARPAPPAAERPLQPVAARASAPVFESTERRAHLLELFTSEGCSSCPPAERWLSRLTESERLWDEVVPVAFHVDYWNGLGWKDPFSAAAYSRRQRRYAASWAGSGGVYTPGFVLDGQEWRGWFGGRRTLPKTSEKTGVLRVALAGGARREATGGRAAARFTSPLDLPATLTLNVAVLGAGLAVDVEAGENGGRTLAHDFVVLAHRQATLARQKGAYAGTVALPSVTKDAERYALAAWVARPGAQAPLQATGGWLSHAPRARAQQKQQSRAGE